MQANYSTNQTELQDKYSKMFKAYPDVLDLPALCKMLRVSEPYVRFRLQQGIIRSYYLYSSHEYMIPKVWAIEFLLSPDYEKSKPLLARKKGGIFL